MRIASGAVVAAMLIGASIGHAGAVSTAGTEWTTRDTIENSRWSSVTFGNGLFVAVSWNGTNQVMTSTDGITWTGHTAAEANGWSSVTFGNGLFVAVSGDGAHQVMTSTDGINWTARTAAAGNWSSVTYGGGQFVAVATGGSNLVMTSPDAITWTARTAASSNRWSSVTYGGGLFVAVSYVGSNAVMTSDDGVTWSSRAVQAALWSVTFGNGLFVAVGEWPLGRVLTSPDGISWTPQEVSSALWWSVTYGGGLFVAVSYHQDSYGSHPVMTSPDGITWTPQTAANHWWRAVTYGAGVFVAVGLPVTSGSSKVMTSSPIAPPNSVPSAPTALSATAGDRSATISFTPGVNGGTSILKYQYSIDGGAVWNDAEAGTTSPVMIRSLTNYTNYSVQIRAVNDVGAGMASAPVAVRPLYEAPSIISVSQTSTRQVLISWALEPDSNAHGSLLAYRGKIFVVGQQAAFRACTGSTSASSCSVGGLTPGSTYEVAVRLWWRVGGPSSPIRRSLHSTRLSITLN